MNWRPRESLGTFATRLSTGTRISLDAILAVVFAPSCAACGASLDSPTRGPVCAACWGAVARITPPVCDACGDPLPSWRTMSQVCGRCPRCRRRPGAVDRGRAIGLYTGSLRSIIHAFKYDGRRSLARGLGEWMRRQGTEVLEGADCTVPVPLHRTRLRTRGFNQAADLAAHLGLPVVDGLRRVRPTRPQAGLPAARRHQNVRNAFGPARALPLGAARHTLRNGCVVLVDDVSTTGATLDACARVLKQLGVREVRALTAARVAPTSP